MPLTVSRSAIVLTMLWQICKLAYHHRWLSRCFAGSIVMEKRTLQTNNATEYVVHASCISTVWLVSKHLAEHSHDVLVK